MKVTIKIVHYLVLTLMFSLIACQSHEAKDQSELTPPIFPDYVGITIPCNLSPINFGIQDASRIYATFACEGNVLLSIEGNDHIEIPLNDWRQVMSKCSGKELQVQVSAWTSQSPDGIAYSPFKVTISPDSIDSHVAYRLIPPGYEEWNKMGLYQRDLSSFEESTIIHNSQNNNGCVNCHSFNNYSPNRFMFHARGLGGGTVIKNGEDLKKINLGALGPNKSGTYPMWHPSGKYIVFSSNTTRQSFYSHCMDKIEVYDLGSDLILYDVEKEDVYEDDRFKDSINWETFPAFSPDGKWLYFCTAKAVNMPSDVQKLRYSLVRVPFHEQDGSFGSPVDTIYSASQQGGSISFPRISPDGQYLLYTWAQCATFPIQHREADLRMIDLATGDSIDTSILNSPETESYHSWSHNGKWIVFSSRRIDSRYTRLFIAPFKDGKFGKPFLLPQKDPSYNETLLYSYNIPEFVNGKIVLSKDQLSELFIVE